MKFRGQTIKASAAYKRYCMKIVSVYDLTNVKKKFRFQTK